MPAARPFLVSCTLLALACRTPSPGAARPAASAAAASPAVAVVQRQLDAYNAQDLEAFLATYADDVVISSASAGKVLQEGKAAVRKRYADLFAKFPRNRANVVERRTEGDHVVLDHEIVTGRAPERPDPWDVGWVRYEVEGGLIRRVVLP